MSTQRNKRNRKKWKNQRVSNYELNYANRDLLGDAKTAPDYIHGSKLYSQSKIDNIIANSKINALGGNISTQSNIHKMLKSVTTHEISGMSTNELHRQMEYGTRLALSSTFKELSPSQISAMIIERGLTDPTTAMQELQALSIETQKPSLMANLSKQFGLIGKRDISNMSTKYSFSSVTPSPLGGERYHKRAGVLHQKLSQAITGQATGFNVADDFRVRNVAGAPVVELDIMKGGKKIPLTLPLTGRMPLNNANYFVYGLFDPVKNQARGGKPLTFADHMINELVEKGGLLDKWDKGKFHFGNTGQQSLQKLRGLYSGYFPNVMPAPKGTGMRGAWEKKYASAVNIEIAEGSTAEQAMGAAIKKRGFFAGTKQEVVSVDAARGMPAMQAVQVHKGVDVSKWVPFGSGDSGVMNWSRKPLNMMRNELYMTESAIGEAHRYQAERGVRSLVTSQGAIDMADKRNLSAAVLYTPKGAMPARFGEGEAMARSAVTDILELEQERHFKISAAPGSSPIAEQILEAERTGKRVSLPKGASLGMGFQTLREVTTKGKTTYASDEMGALLSSTGDDALEEVISAKHTADSDYLHVVTRRMIRGHSGVKVFEDLKHTLMSRGVEEFEREADQIGLDKKVTKMMLNKYNTDIIVEGDILYKDLRLRRTQMTSGLRHVMAAAGIDDKFVSDPLYVEKMSGKHGVEKELLKVARAHRGAIGGAEFGAVFGTYFKELGGYKESEMAADVISDIGFSAKEQAWIRGSKGAALGIAGMTPGGGELAGDIGRGTFEQRALWKMKAEGKYTSELANVMIGRRRLETGGAISEVERAVMTMAGDTGMLTEQQIAGARKIDTSLLAKGVAGNIFAQEGMTVQIPEKYRAAIQGGEHLYLPSHLELKSMSPYVSEATGERMAGTTLTQYEKFLKMMHEDADIGDVKKQARSLNITLSEQYADLAAGKHKLTGTARVQVQKLYQGMGPQPFGQMLTVETSMDLMDKMWSDMRLAGADESYLKGQRAAFKAGEEVMGMAWRHPQVSKFSAVPVKMRLGQDLGGAGFHLRADETMMKDLFRGDFDADRLGLASVMNKREEDSLRRMIADTNFQAEITAYRNDYSLVQAAKRGGAKIDALEHMDVMAQKTKQMLANEIGGVDYAYAQILKGAIATGERKLIDDAALLYDFMPQELISAKHLTAAEARNLQGISGKLLGAVTDISKGYSGRKADALQTIIGGSISNRFNVELLESSVLSRPLETVLTESLAGLKEKDIAEDFMNLAKKGAYDADTLALAEDPRRMISMLRESEMYSAFTPDSTITEAMLRRPRTDSATESLISNVKTKMRSMKGGPGMSAGLIAGATAMAGALFYLAARSREDTPFGGYDIMAAPGGRPIAAPSGTELLVPEMNFQAKPRFVTPDQVQGRTGMPEAPNPIQQTPRGMLNQNQTPMSNVIKIRGRDSANSDYNDITKKIVESMKIPSSVNVNVNDNSKQITSEMIDRLLEGAY